MTPRLLFALVPLLLVSAAPPPARTPAPAAAARLPVDDPIIIHRTRAGDTLPGIAQMWFVEPARWRDAQALNRIEDPNRIPAGTPLRLRTSWLRHAGLPVRVVSFRGTTEAIVKGRAAPMRVGLVLGEGDRLATGANGFLTLRLPDGSLVALPSNTRVHLQRLRQIALTGAVDRRIALESGRAEARVTPMKNADSRFHITTPVAVAAVRGTEFQVTFVPSERRATAQVLEGKVAFGPPGAIGQGTLLLPGFGAVATEAGVQPARRLLAPPTMLLPGRIQSGDTVDVAIEPVPGAVAYRVEISRDEAGFDKVASIETTDPEAVIADVEDGSYFVTVTAVDENGLSGEPGRFAIERRQGADSSERDDDGVETLSGFAAAPDSRLGFDLWGSGRGPGPVDLEPTFALAAGLPPRLPPLPFVPLPAFGQGLEAPIGDSAAAADDRAEEPGPVDLVSSTEPTGIGGGGLGGGDTGGWGSGGGGGRPGSPGPTPGPIDPPAPLLPPEEIVGPPDLGLPDLGPFNPNPIIPGPVVPGPIIPAPGAPGAPGSLDPGPLDPGPLDPGRNDPGPLDPGPPVPPPVALVPEPATWAMLIAGFGLVGVAVRRRRRLEPGARRR